MKELKSSRIIYRCKSCDTKFQLQVSKCDKCLKTDILTMNVYCLDAILSYNALWNIIIGARNTGKSYCIAEFIVNRWKEFKEEFVWIKREKTEFMFGLKIFSEYFGYGIDNKGVYDEETYTTNNGKIKKKKIYFGYNYAISVASKLRGDQLPNVTTIWFDEYAAENGFKRRNEMFLLDSFIETVFREKENCRIFVTSNNAGRFLDIFKRAEINWSEEWTFNWKTDMVTHVANSIKNNKIGKTARYLESTEYYQYAYENKALDFDKQLVESYKLEYLQPIFCFKVGTVRESLRFMKLTDSLYVIDICKNCRHEIFALDEMTSISDITGISREKQSVIYNNYINKNLRYSEPRIKDAIRLWVSRHLYLFEN